MQRLPHPVRADADAVPQRPELVASEWCIGHEQPETHRRTTLEINHSIEGEKKSSKKDVCCFCRKF